MCACKCLCVHELHTTYWMVLSSGSSPGQKQEIMFLFQSERPLFPLAWRNMSSTMGPLKCTVVEFQWQNGLRELLLQEGDMPIVKIDLEENIFRKWIYSIYCRCMCSQCVCCRVFFQRPIINSFPISQIIIYQFWEQAKTRVPAFSPVVLFITVIRQTPEGSLQYIAMIPSHKWWIDLDLGAHEGSRDRSLLY